MSRFIVLFVLLCACDTAASTEQRSGHLAAPPQRRDLDCRDAHYCYRECQGSAFLAGESAAEEHESCAEQCSPQVAGVELDHWSWWIDAVETQCADDWSDACVLAAMVPDLHGDGGDLSGTVLDGCLKPRR